MPYIITFKIVVSFSCNFFMQCKIIRALSHTLHVRAVFAVILRSFYIFSPLICQGTSCPPCNIDLLMSALRPASPPGTLIDPIFN